MIQNAILYIKPKKLKASRGNYIRFIDDPNVLLYQENGEKKFADKQTVPKKRYLYSKIGQKNKLKIK